MKITKIEIQKKNKKRYNLYMDDEFKCGVHEDVIVLMGLYVNQVITEDDYYNILLKEDRAKAKADAIKYLSYRMRSEYEIKDKLRSLEYSDETINYVLSFLSEHKLVNDLEFAKAFIHDKATISRHALSKITYDLKAKGISKQTIEAAKQHYIDSEEDFDFDNAKYLAIKKYRQVYAKNKYSDYEVKQKVYQAITQKGFNIYLVKDALHAALEQEENKEPIE